MSLNNIKSMSIGGRSIDELSLNGRLVFKKQPEYAGLCFTSEVDGTTISFTKTDGVQYSTDGVNWTNWSGSYSFPSVGSKVYFRGTNTSYNNSKFSGEGRYKASGNICSLVDPTLAKMNIGSNCFKKLFNGNDCITEWNGDFQFTSGNSYCYEFMFAFCHNLRSFKGKIYTPLSYTSCMSQFFRECTSLEYIDPDFFSGGGTQTPAWITGWIFGDCSSLKKSPILPAPSSGSHTSTSDGIWAGALNNCTSLEEITVRWTNWPKSRNFQKSYDSWVENIPSTGVFKCPSELGTNDTIARDTDRCPAGWTVVNI